MKSITLAILLVTAFSSTIYSQKLPRFLGEPIMTDTSSILFIPISYNEDILSSNKMGKGGGYHAKIIIYNFKTDTYKPLFEKDTFIASVSEYGYHGREEKIRNMIGKWFFLFVKLKDTNKSGRIDENDPSILFAVSRDGQNLRQLTSENENVTSFESYEQQGFILLRIQKDSDGDKSFKFEDKEYCYRKVNLKDLAVGNAIELKLSDTN
jgi:hypothetical protein